MACCRFAGAVSNPVYLLQVPLMLLIAAIFEGGLGMRIPELAGGIELSVVLEITGVAKRQGCRP